MSYIRWLRTTRLNYLIDMSQWPKVEYGYIFAYSFDRPGIYTQQQLLAWKQLESNNFPEWLCCRVAVWTSDAKSCLLKADVNPSQKAPQNVNKPWIICKPDGKVLFMTRGAVVCEHLGAQ